MRKSKEYIHTFTYGTFLPVYEEKEGIVAYDRADEENKIRVLVNLSDDVSRIPLEQPIEKVLLSNGDYEKQKEDYVELKSCEAIVLKLKQSMQ